MVHFYPTLSWMSCGLSFEDSICFICVVKLISAGWSEVFLFVVLFTRGTAALQLSAVRKASPLLHQRRVSGLPCAPLGGASTSKAVSWRSSGDSELCRGGVVVVVSVSSSLTVLLTVPFYISFCPATIFLLEVIPLEFL